MAWTLGPMYLRRSKDGLRALSHLYHAPVLRSKAGATFLRGCVPEVPSLLRHFAKLVSFPLAQTGEGISECELVAWAVKPGDVVSPFDKLCDVQSDKAAIEITSRYGGRVLALHHVVGAMVKVGAPLVDLEVADDVQVAPEHLASMSAQGTTAGPSAPGPDITVILTPSNAEQQPEAAGTISATKVTVVQAIQEVVPVTAPPPPPRVRPGPAVLPAAPAVPLSAAPTRAAAGEASAATPTASWSSPSARARVQASPAVRAFARENGVDLALVSGTGPGGRVTRTDVALYLETQQQLQQHGRAQGLADLEREEEGDRSDDEGVVLQARDFLRPAGVAGTEAAGGGGGAAAAAAAAGGPRQRGMVEALMTQYKRLAGAAQSSARGQGGEGGGTVVPLRGYRRAMVASMTAAAALPVFHFHDEVAMDRLVGVREALRGDPSLRTAGVRLTLLPFIVKALSAALHQHPHINASLAPNGTELILHPHHNIGVAMATPTGLVVPNIKQVERKSVAQVASELHLLHQLAAAGRLPQEALTGGTITISNIGTIGGTYAAPLVTSPEVAIVALGRMQVLPRYPRPMALSQPAPPHHHQPAASGAAGGPPLRGPPGGIVAGFGGARWGNAAAAVQTPVPVSLMPVSWGADHRVVDGAALAAFSNSWKELLEEPDKLLLHLA